MSVIPGSTEKQDKTGNNSAAKVKSSRKRKVIFSTLEVEKLVSTVTSHSDQLFGPIPRNEKANTWKKIMEAVNGAGQKIRTVKECKIRWQTHRRSLRDKIKKTKDQNQLECILNQRDMSIVKNFGMYDKIANEAVQNTTDPDDPNRRPPSLSNNSSPPQLMASEQSSAPVIPATSEDTVKLTMIDESQQQSPDLDTKLDQLIEQQKCTNSILTSISDSISESVDVQKKILQMQNVIVSSQKEANNYNSVYEVSLKRQNSKERLAKNQLEDCMHNSDLDIELD
ncbi:uncharacterized protein LOC142661395 [Rhinoderma darwinii]|uniref:uncharacterized protein LOC142661395 n=1 Tax=Rhinoderma darwinii TaxID=43563 RepID=UPI003F666C8B